MIRGIYAITTGNYRDTTDLMNRTEHILSGGANVIQYRDKQATQPTRLAHAKALSDLCSTYAVPLIINDDVELAASVDAAGVHLDSDNLSLNEARNRLGKDAIIGVSCQASMRRAVQAQDHGANYVTFGAMYASRINPLASLAPLELIGSAKALLDVDVIAIGGITLDNAAPVIEAGADAIAILAAVYDAPHCKQATQELAALFKSSVSTGDNHDD